MFGPSEGEVGRDWKKTDCDEFYNFIILNLRVILYRRFN
jgi:hypothetical protein